jgi:hypothetical protein
VLGQDAARLGAAHRFDRACGFGGHGGRVFAPGAGVVAIGERLKGGDEVVFAIANQVSAPHRFKCLTQERPVVGIVVAQKGFVQAAALVAAHHVTVSLSRVILRSGFLLLWYMAVAVAMGEG